MRIRFLAPEGWLFVLISLAISLLLFIIWPWLLVPGLLLVLFFAWFFRNPVREGDEDGGSLLSPADGKVMSVTEIDFDPYIEGPAVRVSIFLSIFNVHINRAPMSGKVETISYRPGKFLPAFKSHASDINESNTIGISGAGGRILVRQITGFLARRIVCDLKIDQSVSQRQRIGMIKFGSGTDIIFPSGWEAMVRKGEKVKAGRTVIARKNSKSEVEHDS